MTTSDEQVIDVAVIPQSDPVFNVLKYVLSSVLLIHQPKVVLEVGVDAGNSTRIFSTLLTHWSGRLYSVDLNIPPWLSSWPIRNITFLHGNSLEVEVPSMLDFVFLDGSHRPAQVVEECDRFFPLLSPLGIIAVHDSLKQSVCQSMFGRLREWAVNRKVLGLNCPLGNGLAFFRRIPADA